MRMICRQDSINMFGNRKYFEEVMSRIMPAPKEKNRFFAKRMGYSKCDGPY